MLQVMHLLLFPTVCSPALCVCTVWGGHRPPWRVSFSQEPMRSITRTLWERLHHIIQGIRLSDTWARVGCCSGHDSCFQCLRHIGCYDLAFIPKVRPNHCFAGPQGSSLHLRRIPHWGRFGGPCRILNFMFRGLYGK